MELAPTEDPLPGAPAATEEDLPEGFGGVTPVGRGRRDPGPVATGSLRTALRPLAPLLQEIHDAVSAAPSPPQEVSVQFGVQLCQDFKLGIVGASGQANLTVSATWQLPARTADPSGSVAGAIAQPR